MRHGEGVLCTDQGTRRFCGGAYQCSDFEEFGKDDKVERIRDSEQVGEIDDCAAVE